jgi:hypothetical protein
MVGRGKNLFLYSKGGKPKFLFLRLPSTDIKCKVKGHNKDKIGLHNQLSMIFFSHFLSPDVSGRVQSLALWILSLVFYPCAPGHSLLLLIPFCHSLPPLPVAGFKSLIFGL